MISIKTVNNALKKLGHEEKLCKGNGYFYFYDGNADNWYTSSVGVYTINQLTLDQWIESFLRLKEDHKKRAELYGWSV